MTLDNKLNIQIVSDIHSDMSQIKINPKADIVIGAGDFTVYGVLRNEIVEFKEFCDKHQKPHLVVLGNHDYYGSLYRKDLLKKLESKGVNVLYTGKIIEFKGFTFIGDTLFTAFDLFGDIPTAMQMASVFVTDFGGVMRNGSGDLITPSDIACYFKEQWAFIEKFRNQKNVIVVTHFPPAKECSDPKYKDHPATPYYINNLNLTGFSHWICGHVHRTCHLKSNGCNIYINASGYTHKNGIRECPDFISDWVIEINKE